MKKKYHSTLEIGFFMSSHFAYMHTYNVFGLNHLLKINLDISYQKSQKVYEFLTAQNVLRVLINGLTLSVQLSMSTYKLFHTFLDLL